MEDYRKLRTTFDRSSPDDQARAHAEANEFYLEHLEEMDAGCEVSWEHCFREDEDELSAIQHAYNILIDDGEDVFASECQNDPKPAIAVGAGELTADQIARKVSVYAAGVVPPGSEKLDAFIDPHLGVLYYGVGAWEPDFTGSVIDYGTWPNQRTNYFALREARYTLAKQYPGTQMEGWLRAGLDELVALIAGFEWIRDDDGASMRIDRILVDANWGDSRDVVYQFCRESPHSAILTPSHGMYIGASSRPLNDKQHRKGDRIGLNWRQPRVANRREVRHVVFDPNFYKSFVHSRLAAPLGARGSLCLHAGEPHEHRLLADHAVAEYRVHTQGRGRRVDEWKVRPQHEDNHYLDVLAGLCVGASMEGIALPTNTGDERSRKKRRKWSFSGGEPRRAQ
jgi:hypothetical protein